MMSCANAHAYKIVYHAWASKCKNCNIRVQRKFQQIGYYDKRVKNFILLLALLYRHHLFITLSENPETRPAGRPTVRLCIYNIKFLMPCLFLKITMPIFVFWKHHLFVFAFNRTINPVWFSIKVRKLREAIKMSMSIGTNRKISLVQALKALWLL